MSNIKCNTCGSQQLEERKVDYLYHYQGKYLLVPNTPIEVCLSCGMLYYEAKVLKKKLNNISLQFMIMMNNLINAYLFRQRFFLEATGSVDFR